MSTQPPSRAITSSPAPSAHRPAAIVLKLGITGMATARALTKGGVNVHVAAFNRTDPGLRSCCYTVVDLTSIGNRPNRVLEWLLEYTARLGNRPVVFPTSDTFSLMLAQHRDRLLEVCRVWNTSYDQLNTIVSKERLYAVAEKSGVPVLPMIVAPGLEQLADWCRKHPAPYFVKPYYEAVPGCALGMKNRIFDTSAELLDYVDRNGSAELIVQRLIEGGDGHVFDCYGMCAEDGQPTVLATRTCLRQNPPNRGTTTYGEIPAALKEADQEVLFSQTCQLLNVVRYHGIFDIEWLRDRATGTFYLIDFNARPFVSVGHLQDCGLNLPLLAYRELIGEPMGNLPLIPRLRHRLWVNFWTDFNTFREVRKQRRLSFLEWLYSLLKCRSFAYWDASDPNPAYQITRERLTAIRRKLLRH